MPKSIINLVGVCLGVTLLASCDGGNALSASTAVSVAPQIGTPYSGRGATSQHLGALARRRPLASGTEKVIYSFKGGSDGAVPDSGVIDVGGALYGVTIQGGATGRGTVYKVSTSGAESVLYTFQGPPADGSNPYQALTDVNGTLYGTTYAGGTSGTASPPGPCQGVTGCGTVFALSLSGAESVLYNFQGGLNGPDAAKPGAGGGLTVDKGAMYGMTAYGGSPGGGTVFSVSTSGVEKVLHSFGSESGDGSGPLNGLTDVKGMLYGTTQDGGGYCDCGTVFKMSASGDESVLYSFPYKGGSEPEPDGAYPNPQLIYVKGTLYGTTSLGGTTSGGYGTVFKVARSGSERVLYSFKGGADGKYPDSGLIYVKGALYGLTSDGGASGLGTVFKVTTSGKESVLYSFKGDVAGDGSYPGAGSLIDVEGTLYGITSGGGANNLGTVFSITP